MHCWLFSAKRTRSMAGLDPAVTSICMRISCCAACLPGEIEHLDIMTGRPSTSEFGMVLLAWALLVLDHEYGSYQDMVFPEECIVDT
ncbi:uncharacterized protein BDV14DRAFT_184580 [Aspergillus stella-maris]|uniref:uncharacterized protein n=1 Tax=Aspergillus stella-maris TaxID=1810926 RepID=UPI003CCE1321